MSVSNKDIICAIYCRVSTDKQKEKHTIASQKRILPELAKAKGWSVYKMYVDDGISGESLQNMIGLQSLLADAEKQLFSFILVIDIDRFTRFRRESERALIVDICLENKIEVVTPDGRYDLNNRNDRLQFAIKGTVSLYEKETIRDRCLRGIKEKRLQGRWLGGTPAMGFKYDRNTQRLEVDESELPDLEKIFRLSIDNSAREVARKLGSRHSPRKIRRILEPERLFFYSGFHRVDGELVRGHWPVLLSDQLRLKILTAKIHRNARGTHSTRAKYLLTGLGILRCGYCGFSMKSWPGVYKCKDGTISQKMYYHCAAKQRIDKRCQRKRVNMELIDSSVIKSLKTTLGYPDKLRAAFEVANNEDVSKKRLKTLTEEIKKEKQAKDRIVSAVGAGVISFEEARSEMEQIRERLGVLEDEFESLSAATSEWNDGLIEFFCSMAVNTTDFDELRNVFQACIKEIKSYNNYLIIEYKFPVTKSGSFTKRIQL